MKIPFFIILISFLGIANAQDQLRIEYEITPFFETERAMPNFVVTSKTSYYELLVGKNESNWDYIERLSNEQILPEKGMMSASFEIKSLGTLYKNISKGTWIEDTQFNSTSYLIHGKLQEIDWKISRESKTILGIHVQKAEGMLDDKNKTQVVAWYAPKLNFKNGPGEFGGLPGLILELETEIKYENGDREGITYKAIKLETLKSNKKIKIPTKGKEISEKEFKTIQQKYSEEMMQKFKSDGVNKD